MSWLSSLVGDITGTNGIKDAARTQRDVAEDNNAATLEMYYDNAGRQQPFIEAGYGAMNEQNALLGLAQVATPGPGEPGGAPGSTAPNPYFDRYPGVAREYANNSDISDRWTPNEFSDIHYRDFGRAEGRTAPGDFTGTAPGSAPTAPSVVGVGGGAFQQTGSNALAQIDPTVQRDTSQDGAYDRFLEGGFNRSMTDVTGNDLAQISGAFGAAGSSVSGSAQGAMMDRLARNRNTAFGQYYNALAGISGSGQVAVRDTNAAGQAATNSMNQNNQNAANATSSYQIARGEGVRNLIGAGVGVASDRGWF